MVKLLRHPVARLACWYLSAFLAGFFALPAVAEAAFVPSAVAPSGERAGEQGIAALRASLENEVLAGKLASLGLSPREVGARLDRLSPEERQAVLGELSSLQSGGDAVGALIGIAVLVLLVVLILKLLNKEVVIR